ncbi:hypothetical protein NESM_000606400 [Novymonas esmeraldas]|uniref:Metallo-beta-lactamase domain-containing protein n=1 Tax=Novymonas esmeraldas TaxID=1808958 RepID=A0AAW0ERM8_9TRYP
MRLPLLPIVIDEFPALGDRDEAAPLFFLTHMHTDHTKGLSSTWSAGLLLTSHVTRRLLLDKFDGLRHRVVGLPLWCRTPILRAGDTAVVYVTLLPAFHIPGSAMLYFEAPSGLTYLHTGDFKFAESAADQYLLRSFLQSHRVDHLYLDDTWLHLGHAELTHWPGCSTASAVGQSGTSAADSGVRVLSKLLDAAQVEEAVEAVGRRMDYQRQVHAKWTQQQHQQQQQQRSCDGSACDAGSHSSSPTTPLSAEQGGERLPFVVRVYLHNQFGKEMLIQMLAARLRTRALIDDARYSRLLTVVEALKEEQQQQQQQQEQQERVDVVATLAEDAPPQRPPLALSAEAREWCAAGGEAAYYPFDLSFFVSASQAQQQRQQQRQRQRQQHGTTESHRHRQWEPPLVEVVSSRASIAPEALQAAAAARGGTPHYGVVMSGWARLQSQTHGPATSGLVWHIPTTLHCTPQEVISLVALLRPQSVTPLHYRPSRGVVIMQRLGPYLRTPFVNRHDTGAETASAGGVACAWVPCLPAAVLGALPGSGASGGDGGGDGDGGDDALARVSRRPFRIGAAAPLLVADAPVHGGTAAPIVSYYRSSSSSSAAPRVAELLSPWRLRLLTQSYLNTVRTAEKRCRSAEGDALASSASRGARRSGSGATAEGGAAAAAPSLSNLADDLLR